MSEIKLLRLFDLANQDLLFFRLTDTTALLVVATSSSTVLVVVLGVAVTILMYLGLWNVGEEQ